MKDRLHAVELAQSTQSSLLFNLPQCLFDSESGHRNVHFNRQDLKTRSLEQRYKSSLLSLKRESPGKKTFPFTQNVRTELLWRSVRTGRF